MLSDVKRNTYLCVTKDKLKHMNILITGCNGQLGNEMMLLEKGDSNTYFNTDVAKLDITNAETVAHFVEENQIDGIMNCAAYTAVDKAESDEAFCRKLNADAPGYLAEAIERRGGWMIQISTDYVFDGTQGRRELSEQSLWAHEARRRAKRDEPLPSGNGYPHGVALLHFRQQFRENDAPFGS